MDRNRNDDIRHDDADLGGMGDERPRDTEKHANARNNKDVRRGRDGFSGRAGEPSGGSGR